MRYSLLGGECRAGTATTVASVGAGNDSAPVGDRDEQTDGGVKKEDDAVPTVMGRR
jgi:hypothetical protein